MKDKQYTVYKHTAPNGKIYIGITSQKPNKRWQSGNGYKHNKYIFRAIQKYGWNNIKHEILAEQLSVEEAEKMEKQLIIEYKTTNPLYGFNILEGGDARQGLCGELNPMFGVHLCGESNPMYGKHRTEETKKKISESKKGAKLTEEHKKILSERFSGELNPMFGVHRYGEKNPFYQKQHTEEAKRKISESRKGKYKGANNPHARKIICLTTGEIFDSLSCAVKKYGVSQGNLSIACQNPNRTCGKTQNGTRLKWQYYDKYLCNKEVV